MPIHDWNRVRANRFHHFHQDWTVEIARTLNRGLLPDNYLAMAEQVTGGPEPDVVTLSLPVKPGDGATGGLAVADAPPKTRVQTQADAVRYARKANRVTVRHPDGEVVAVIEIVSPGNKDSKHAARSFARKAVEFLFAGVHLLIVDLFPPSRRDPQGVHKLIWDRIRDEPFELPSDKPLTLAAYSAGTAITGYVEPIAVGDAMPDMPVFLTADRYVPCPLETTYQASWDVYPKALKAELEAPPAK
ncbi:MAG TPA: DUF4058 family protein [Fimbriiglobus sp.]|jgi:hypothetical protein|nr:DUF4058 family protein [Fimbriiglobus sp.]